MTDLQSDVFRMLKLLAAFLKKNVELVLTIPAFKRGLDKLELLITEITDADSGRPSITSGKAKAKNNAKEKLAKAIYNLGLGLFTYAHEHKKPEVLARVGHTKNYYFNYRDANLPLEAADLVKLTVGIEAELLDHGISAEQIAKVTTLSKIFEAAVDDLGTSEAKGTGATKSVYQLIGEAQELVRNQLNAHAEKLKEEHHEFYTQYQNASHIVEHGGKQSKKDDENKDESGDNKQTPPPDEPDKSK
jgi:hypothetical protein